MSAVAEKPKKPDEPKKADGELTVLRASLEVAYREFLALADVSRKAAQVVEEVIRTKPALLPGGIVDDPAMAAWHKKKADAETASRAAAAKTEGRRQQIEPQLVGVRVTYWFPDGRPPGYVAMMGHVVGLGHDGKADISCFGRSYKQLSPRRGVPWSETPKVNCWTWMPNGLV